MITIMEISNDQVDINCNSKNVLIPTRNTFILERNSCGKLKLKT